MIVFEAWEDENGITFSTQENISNQKKNGLLSIDAKLLHKIEANNYEEAIVLHYNKMGWEPYKAM